MSQHDYNIANAAGATVRADINDVLGAIATWNSGASDPATTFARMRAVNTTSGVVKRRNAANSAWLIESTDDESRVLSRSSNTILDVSDIGKAIIATGTFTQTLDAAATLADGWYVDYRNDGTGIITIDPNGAETIDGATTIKLYTGESCRIWCNGSAFKTTGRSTGRIKIQTISASGAATTDFTIGIDDSFDVYEVDITDYRPATDAQLLYARVSTDGGASFLSTNEYDWVVSGEAANATELGTGQESVAQWVVASVSPGNQAGEHLNARMSFHGLSGATRYKSAHAVVSEYDSTPRTGIFISGAVFKTTSAINALRFLSASGNHSGAFTLYGVRK